MQVAHGGADMAVAEQALQRGQIDPGLQQVGGEGVSQAVDATFTSNAGSVAGGAVHALCHFDAHRAIAGGVGKQPQARPAIMPVAAQGLQQSGREQRIAILAALCCRQTYVAVRSQPDVGESVSSY